MELLCKEPEDAKIPGQDWDSLMWHNGKLFSGSYSNGKVKVWSPDLKPVHEFDAHEYPIYHMTPGNGKTFFTSSSDCMIRHWDENEDGTSFLLLATLEGHTEPPIKLRFHKDRLYSGDETGEVWIWEDGKSIGKIETMEEIWDLVVMDGHFVTVRHIDATIFSLTERDSGNIRSAVKNSIPGRAPLHIASGRLCCIDRNENVVHVHDREKTGNPLVGKLKGHEAIINAMTSIGSNLITGACDNSVIAWNLDSLSQVGKVTVDGYVNALVVNPDGKIYAAGENKFIVCLKL